MRKTFRTSSALLIVLATGCGQGDETARTSQPVQSEPIFVPDNPDCESLGLTSFWYKVDPPDSGTYPLDALNTVVVSVDDLLFDWSSTLSIDAVIVKGGPNANLYLYDPEALSNDGEPSLHAPVNPSNGLYYGLSHIEFCFDYEVTVAKTALPSFQRTYDWEIDKTSTVTELLLSDGQVYLVPYEVTVAVAGYTDSDWQVAGAVVVHNPAPFAAVLTGIADLLDGDPVALDCGVDFPFTLPAGATLECSYQVALGAAPAAPLVNAVEVTTTGPVGGGGATAIADFTSATIDAVDDCVDVTDDQVGPLGSVCVGDAPRTFAYDGAAGPYECGEHQLVNVASLVTDDTGATGSDAWTIAVTVPCELGCTLTPGYWKTHSSHGPAPYDDTWALLPAGAETPFYLSGQTYYQALWTPPARNAYYILARAFIAAQLNQLDGASFGAAQSAWDQAAALLAVYTPADIAALKGAAGNGLRAQLIALAATLDAYNNGLIGPGHCDE